MEKYKARQDLSIYPVKAAFSHSWWPDQFEGKEGRTHKSSQMILLSSPEKSIISINLQEEEGGHKMIRLLSSNTALT